jgi:uncharacterized protein involved in response to NO
MRLAAWHTDVADRGPRSTTQEPFERVAPLLRAALLLGAGGGFALAALLTTTQALRLPAGLWWQAAAQAHGHVQLYGWAGLFVLGVGLHFLPRLRGAPLVHPRLLPWCLGLLVAGLLARALGQPLLAASAAPAWQMLTSVSGALELLSVTGLIAVAALTLTAGPPMRTRKAFWGVAPFLAGAFAALEVAALVNGANTFALSGSTMSLVPGSADELNISLGLFGFLVPMALAMSAQSLPLYAGLEAFPRRLLWPLGGAYFAGLSAFCAGIVAQASGSALGDALRGLGMLAMGSVLLTFIAVFLRMMRARGRLPERVASLTPEPETTRRHYTATLASARGDFGPFVGLVASAYLWAMFAGVLLLVDGSALLLGGQMPVTLDAVRHALAIGFVALLICGIAPRMVPGFAGGRIASPRYVCATLWLGNLSAVLRVGSILLAPALASGGGATLDSLLFGLSGPAGLALALCLALNLWPALSAAPRAIHGTSFGAFKHTPVVKSCLD